MIESPDFEKALLDEAHRGEWVWSAISRRLLDIKDNNLFKEVSDDVTGKPIRSFEAYLRRVSKLLRPKLASGSISTLKVWMTKFMVYGDQLGYNDDWLMTMGSHANVMLKAANLGKGSNLDNVDRTLQTGGQKLGLHNFKV